MYRVGIIGCGEVARLLVKQWPAEWQLVAVTNEYPLPEGEVWSSLPFFTDFREMLKSVPDMDLVVVCSPTGLHAEHVITALQNRRHVIAVSPLCLTVSAAQQVMDTAKFSGNQVRLMRVDYHEPQLNLTHRNNQPVMQISYRALKDWEQTQFPGGGMLYNHGFTALQELSETYGPVTIIEQQGDLFTWRSRDGREGKIEVYNNLNLEPAGITVEGPPLTEAYNPVPVLIPTLSALENFYSPNQFSH